MGYYFDEENAKPSTAKQAKLLVGKNVKYLRRQDIDKTGRGYFFPRTGVVNDSYGKTIEIDGNQVSFSEIVELVLIRE